MRVFFDEEFTGLHKDTSLISIGLISEDNTTFYAEFTDYDKSQVNDWIEENVINNLKFNDREQFVEIEPVPFNKSAKMRGTKENVRSILLEWLKQFDMVEWVSDVCHYDFVLLIDLLCGNALNMPKNYCSACHDINQDIAKYYNISEIEAFDKSREEIIKEFKIDIHGDKHNSLYDAKVIKAIYENLK